MRRATPGNGLQQRQRPRVRGDHPVDLLRQPLDGLVGGVDAGQHLGGQQAVVDVEVAPQRRPQLGELGAQAPLGQLGHGRGVAAAADEGGEHGPARHPQDVAGHRRQLDARVLEHLLQALGLAGALLDDHLAVASQVAQLADRAWWHEAGADQAVLDQLADPGRVADVGLAAGDVAQVVRVQEPALEPLLERLEHRLPVHAGGLHPDERDAGLRQPGGELGEPCER